MTGNDEERVYVEIPAHEPEPPRVIRSRRILIWAGALVLIGLLAVGLSGRQSYDSKSVPASLVGEWVSAHPEYSDRYLILTPTSITFGVGGTSSVKYTVLGIVKREDDAIELHFKDAAGTTFKRAIVVDPVGSNFHFESQPAVVWHQYGS